MDQERLKRNLRRSAIAFIIAVGVMTRALAHDDVRTVTILSIFVAGVTGGVLLMNVILKNNNK